MWNAKRNGLVQLHYPDPEDEGNAGAYWEVRITNRGKIFRRFITLEELLELTYRRIH